MNITVITFTCRRDAPLLPLWAAFCRRALAAHHFTLIAAVEPQDCDIPAPDDVNVLPVSFPRRGNLNGKEAVLGILATIAAAGMQTNARWVVKLDTDTVLTGAGWLTSPEALHASYIGFEGCNPCTATGICYTIAPEFAQLILDSNNPWPWMDGKLPEDFTICSLAIMAQSHRGEALLLPFGRGEHVRAAQLGVPARSALPATAVHCGQWQALQSSPLPRTETVARFMRGYLTHFGLSLAENGE